MENPADILQHKHCHNSLICFFCCKHLCQNVLIITVKSCCDFLTGTKAMETLCLMQLKEASLATIDKSLFPVLNLWSSCCYRVNCKSDKIILLSLVKLMGGPKFWWVKPLLSAPPSPPAVRCLCCLCKCSLCRSNIATEMLNLYALKNKTKQNTLLR